MKLAELSNNSFEWKNVSFLLGGQNVLLPRAPTCFQEVKTPPPKLPHGLHPCVYQCTVACGLHNAACYWLSATSREKTSMSTLSEAGCWRLVRVYYIYRCCTTRHQPTYRLSYDQLEQKIPRAYWNEAPMALISRHRRRRWDGDWGGVSTSPSRIEGLGSVVSSPCSRVRATAFSALSECHRALQRKENAVLNVATVLTTAIAEICWNSVENFWGEHFGGWSRNPAPALNAANLVRRWLRIRLDGSSTALRPFDDLYYNRAAALRPK